MEQNNRDNDLSQVLRCVNCFAEVYVEAVSRWMLKEKCDASMLKFILGISPYIFPPIMIYSRDGKQKRIHSYMLPYRDGENSITDSYASDINSYLLRNMGYLHSVTERFEEHLKKLHKIQHITDLKSEVLSENMKLMMEGFFKEMNYGRFSLSINDYIREKGDEEEEQIIKYLESGIVYLQSPVKIKDIINYKKGVIGHVRFLTDGSWLWPAELAYYVKIYHLRLNDKFIETMRRNDWQIKDIPPLDYSKIELINDNWLGIDSLRDVKNKFNIKE